MSGPILKPAGFLREATITRVDPSTMTAYISFKPSSSGMSGIGTDDSTACPAQLPISYLSAGGGFIGGFPAEGTPVIVSQAEGASNYYIVAFFAKSPAARNTINTYQLQIPTLTRDEITIQANPNGTINLNPDSIIIGEPRNSVTFDTTRKIHLNTFDYSYFVGQGSKLIDGVVKRDRRPKKNYPPSMRLNDVEYDDNLKIIGMDPVSDARNSNAGVAIRNPARVEKREVVNEYEDIAQVGSNDQELSFYQTGDFISEQNILNRRESRVDALSLSLVAPNYLMESIKGTVVDIFGNLVDLNRTIIPIGLKDATTTATNVISVANIKSTATKSNTFDNIYEQIKRLERRSLAYHFEINAKKESSVGPDWISASGPPNVNNTDNYARARSRFYLDIDKEGQLKLNVPASSEMGNIPLLARYENFSTVNPNQSTNDPNDLVFNPTYVDVLTEPFANIPVISLKDDLGNPTGALDRFTSNIYIKHGTVYHDISQTVSTLQANSFYNPYPSAEYPQTTPLAFGQVPPLSASIVSKTIIVSGANANAGGRSASLNFDGSLEINIGANTVDRQSLWLDTQGGAVVNLGRDLKNNVSLAMNADGQVLLQIGGNTVPAETNRFQNSQTGWMAGVLDIRVFAATNTDGHYEMTIFRIDGTGVQVTTPGRMTFYAAEAMTFASSRMQFTSDDMVINGRQMILEPGAGNVR